jgi:hypothetical protein
MLHPLHSAALHGLHLDCFGCMTVLPWSDLSWEEGLFMGFQWRVFGVPVDCLFLASDFFGSRVQVHVGVHSARCSEALFPAASTVVPARPKQNTHHEFPAFSGCAKLLLELHSSTLKTVFDGSKRPKLRMLRRRSCVHVCVRARACARVCVPAVHMIYSRGDMHSSNRLASCVLKHKHHFWVFFRLITTCIWAVTSELALCFGGAKP